VPKTFFRGAAQIKSQWGLGLVCFLIAAVAFSAQVVTIDFNKDNAGVWTKADSVIYFDDLQITVL